MTTKNEQILKRSGGPTKASYLKDDQLNEKISENKMQRNKKYFNNLKELDEPKIDSESRYKMSKKENLRRKAKNQKNSLNKQLKFGSYQPKPDIIVKKQEPKDRLILNEETAFTNKPAKIIKVEQTQKNEMSKRKIKEARKYLSKNNFPELPVVAHNDEPKKEKETVIIEKELYDSMLAVIMKNARCYDCGSKYFGYSWGYDGWATMACRVSSCYSTTKFHPSHGFISLGSWLAITNPRENQCEEDTKITTQKPKVVHKEVDETPLKIDEKVEKREVVIQNNPTVISKEKNEKKIRKEFVPGPKIPQIIKLSFDQQKQINNIGVRDVSTIPVTMSYKDALVKYKPLKKIQPNLSNTTLNDTIDIYRKLRYKLQGQWYKNLRVKPYYNPYLEQDAYIERFRNENDLTIDAALHEWFVCACLFGDETKIHRRWSDYIFKYKN